MNRKILIVGGLAVIAVIVIATIFIRGGGGFSPQEVSTEDPVNTTLNFYEAWMSAAQSTTTNPYQEELDQTAILSKELRAKLKSAEVRSDNEIDPVLCQTSPSSKVAALPVYEREDSAQVVVLPRGEGKTEQSIFTLLKQGDGWYIDSIECAAGEFAPEREFSFDTEGYLLKSVPAPLDSNYWHLVFEEAGEMGHAARLYFDGASTCVGLDGNETTCDSGQFTEPSKVHIQGQMTETGVEVKRMIYEEGE